MIVEKVEGLWTPYFKPLESEHDSGFLCFEIGYIGPCGSKVVLNNEVDVINLGPQFSLKMDHDGPEIRIYDSRSKENHLRWKDPGYSDGELELADEPLAIQLG